MKTLAKIKDEIAQEYGSSSYDSYRVYRGNYGLSEAFVDDVAKCYAIEILVEAAQIAETHNLGNCEGETVNKQSILCIINELK